jgi:hypothetical protein
MPIVSKRIKAGSLPLMDKSSNNGGMNVLFHERAGQALQTLYREFKYCTSALDRQWDENVFQQQQGKYTALLRHRLDRIALEVMENLDTDADRNAWSHSVNQLIQDYMREFGQKIRSL